MAFRQNAAIGLACRPVLLFQHFQLVPESATRFGLPGDSNLQARASCCWTSLADVCLQRTRKGLVWGPVEDFDRNTLTVGVAASTGIVPFGRQGKLRKAAGASSQEGRSVGTLCCLQRHLKQLAHALLFEVVFQLPALHRGRVHVAKAKTLALSYRLLILASVASREHPTFMNSCCQRF